MSNLKFLQITLQERMKSNSKDTVEHPEFVLTYAQRNDDKDNQVINYANKNARQWKQLFSKSYGNDYAFGLHVTYSEVVEGNSKLNKLTQDYIKHNFKDETCFRRYFMNHKNAPKSSLDVKF